MQSNTPKRHPLVELLEDVGGEYELRSYSGRSMYGDDCLGVVGDLSRIVASIVGACLEAGEDLSRDEKYEITQAMRQMRVDSMGCEVVAYFPGVKYDEPAHCEFDDCAREATERRGDFCFCPRHAREADALEAAAEKRS